MDLPTYSSIYVYVSSFIQSRTSAHEFLKTEEGNAQTLTDLHWRMQRIGEQIALQQYNGQDVSVHLEAFRGSVFLVSDEIG